MSIERILEPIGWLLSDAMKNRTAFAKPQIVNAEGQKINVVVERPDRHCGDDLVCLSMAGMARLNRHRTVVCKFPAHRN